MCFLYSCRLGEGERERAGSDPQGRNAGSAHSLRLPLGLTRPDTAPDRGKSKEEKKEGQELREINTIQEGDGQNSGSRNKHRRSQSVANISRERSRGDRPSRVGVGGADKERSRDKPLRTRRPAPLGSEKSKDRKRDKERDKERDGDVSPHTPPSDDSSQSTPTLGPASSGAEPQTLGLPQEAQAGQPKHGRKRKTSVGKTLAPHNLIFLLFEVSFDS